MFSAEPILCFCFVQKLLQYSVTTWFHPSPAVTFPHGATRRCFLICVVLCWQQKTATTEVVFVPPASPLVGFCLVSVGLVSIKSLQAPVTVPCSLSHSSLNACSTAFLPPRLFAACRRSSENGGGVSVPHTRRWPSQPLRVVPEVSAACTVTLAYHSSILKRIDLHCFTLIKIYCKCHSWYKWDKQKGGKNRAAHSELPRTAIL